MSAKKIEKIEQRFQKRYQTKKIVNLVISLLIAILGILSVIYIWNHDQDGLLTFRWMTVDGTIFTTVISFAFTIVNITEILKYTELTSKTVYFARLASAVAEGLILIVVLLSQLPFFPEHMHILRFDMFQMHIVIPILTISSFVLNDSPLGRLRFPQILQGTWFVTLYAVTILGLILSGTIPSDMIPYAFLDVFHMNGLSIFLTVCFIYALSIFLSRYLSELNRKLSWIWFKDITRK